MLGLHRLDDLDKDTRVTLSNKEVYLIELVRPLVGNTQTISVKLPYDGLMALPVYSFYMGDDGRMVNNGEAGIVTEDGVTYAVFGTTHLSALWAIGPLEDGDFDPAGYGGTIAGAFVAITMVVAFMVPYLLRMRPKIRTRS